MSSERLRLLALRWGLVSLGALALVTVRLFTTWLQVWQKLSESTDWRVLSARMSQLKPYPFKAPYLAAYFWALALLLGGALGILFYRGVREALRPAPPDQGSSENS